MFVLWANHATKSIYTSGERVCVVVRDKGEDLRNNRWGVVSESVGGFKPREEAKRWGRRLLLPFDCTVSFFFIILCFN